jgi:hypothetical protein
MDDRWRLAGGDLRPGALFLEFFRLLLAGVAFAADLRRRGRGSGHAHHLIRDAICLMF